MNTKNKLINVCVFILTIVVSVFIYLAFVKDTNTVIENQLGVTPGNDFSYSDFTFGGVGKRFVGKKLISATSTPCAAISPSSTSTITSRLTVNVGSSTASTWTIARAASPNATTTALEEYSLSSGVQGTFSFQNTASSTVGQSGLVDKLGVVPPNTWVVWGVKGTASYGTGWTGSCAIEFTY